MYFIICWNSLSQRGTRGVEKQVMECGGLLLRRRFTAAGVGEAGFRFFLLCAANVWSDDDLGTSANNSPDSEP